MFKAIKNVGKDLMSSAKVYRAGVIEAGGFWKFQAKTLEGKEVDFSTYKGFVSLIINVASK